MGFKFVDIAESELSFIYLCEIQAEIIFLILPTTSGAGIQERAQHTQGKKAHASVIKCLDRLPKKKTKKSLDHQLDRPGLEEM